MIATVTGAEHLHRQNEGKREEKKQQQQCQCNIDDWSSAVSGLLTISFSADRHHHLWFFPAKERDNVTRKGTPEGNKKVLSIRLHLNCHCNCLDSPLTGTDQKLTGTTTKNHHQNWRVNIAINHWRWLLLLLLLALDDELNSSSFSSSFLLVAANNNKHRKRRGRRRDDGTKEDWRGDKSKDQTHTLNLLGNWEKTMAQEDLLCLCLGSLCALLTSAQCTASLFDLSRSTLFPSRCLKMFALSG